MSGVFSRRGAQPPPPPPPAPAAPAEADPSMEDILASIRRILNEGESETPSPEVVANEPAATVASPEPPAPAVTVAESAPGPEVHVPEPEKETQSSSTPANEPVEVEDVFILDTAMMVADAVVDTVPEAPIASSETMAAASQSVGALKKALSERQAQVYKAHAISLEEIVREEVRPMLKSWLDSHLPSIVERLVRTEIERVVAREML
jgi:cell pole-organizing protein PopZ